MSHKESAVGFLQMAASGDVQRAFERYIAPDFIHHNQHFKGDRQALLQAMESAAKSNPSRQLQIRQVYQDGDVVIVHSHVRRSVDDVGLAVVHIFRFAGARVVELWDLGQRLDADSPNENGPF